MTQAETACPDVWGSHFLEYRGRLLALARRNLNPVLARRVSAEDVVQEALLAACGKMAFFENNPEIPVYFKLRMILFQTDVYKRQIGIMAPCLPAKGGIPW